MRVPDPKANTTTEAYLAYKAGYLEESELKPKLYKPDWHFDGWLAYWAGLVNTYPTKENGDPDMLCDEEALVAYLSGVTDTYPEEIKDPYDVRIVGYLKYLVSARWGRPEYPVNNEEFYLSTMKPPVVPSGDTPSSDIEMDDTAEAPFIDLKMYGDTSQQTYSGANLFNYTDVNFVSPGVTVGDDGWVTIAYDNSGGGTTKYLNYYTNKLPLITSTNYNILLEIKNSTGNFSLYPVSIASNSQFSANWYVRSDSISEGGIYSTVIMTNPDFDNDTISLRTTLALSPGNSGSVTFRISLLADTSVTPETFVYQPYTGNIPAPNPDYPQDIDVVTGRQMVAVTGGDSESAEYEINLGKNLFDNSLSPVYSTGATPEPLSTGIRINTTETQGNCFCGFRLFKSSNFVGKTITLSANVTASGPNQPNAYIGICAENGSSRVAKVFMTGTGEKSVSYTHTEEDASRPYIMVALYSNYAGGTPQVGTYADFNNLQLEVGSTATSYAPYFEPIELCKIGDYQDYIYRDEDGDWYLHKACEKMIIDGNNVSWSVQASTGSPDYYYAFTNKYDSVDNATNLVGICDRFIHVSSLGGGTQVTSDSYAFLERTSTVSQHFRIMILQSRVSSGTSSGINDFFNSNPITVYYPLATATDTQITNSELIAQLDALMEGGSYEGKTYIKVTATAPNLPGLLYVEAGKYD